MKYQLRNFSIFAAILLASVLSSGCGNRLEQSKDGTGTQNVGDADGGDNVAERKVLRIEILDESFILNGKELKLPVPPEEIRKLLGEPSRETKLANTILTWDELGLCAYVNPGSERVIEIHIFFKKDKLPFTPKKVFAGKAILDGSIIAESSTKEDINSVRRDKPFQNTLESMPFWVRRKQGTQSLIFESLNKENGSLKYFIIAVATH
jgi:hypothetical protein